MVDPTVDPAVDPAVDPTVDPAVDPAVDPIGGVEAPNVIVCPRLSTVATEDL
jgi:hypothetical protein